MLKIVLYFFFFFQAEDGIRDYKVTGVQTCALPISEDLRRRMSGIPGAVDVHLAQVTNTPELFVDVDRSFAEEIGLTQKDVTSDILISLSSNGQTAPNFWLDPGTGVQYPVAVQTPQWRIDSIATLEATPLTAGPTGARPQLLSNVAGVKRLIGPTNVTHYNIARTLDVVVGVDGADLGSVAASVQRIVEEAQRRLPRGTSISVEGEA